VNTQTFSHFLSHSPWDHRKLTDWIITLEWQTIERNGGLVIDECGYPKAGKHLVGVFTAYVKDEHRLLLNHRLHLPADWITDPVRCDAAGIPKIIRHSRPKPSLHMK